MYWVRLEDEDADGEFKVGLVEVNNVGTTAASSAWFVRTPLKDPPHTWPQNPAFQHFKVTQGRQSKRLIDELDFEAFLMEVEGIRLEPRTRD